ncbi:hypothetical protein [Parvibaculum sp.]|uniref:hypothetical protein n=1 Tax=Parvibaculum sp. TaxID=2024848 RepID=UPI003C759D22
MPERKRAPHPRASLTAPRNSLAPSCVRARSRSIQRRICAQSVWRTSFTSALTACDGAVRPASAINSFHAVAWVTTTSCTGPTSNPLTSVASRSLLNTRRIIALSTSAMVSRRTEARVSASRKAALSAS